MSRNHPHPFSRISASGRGRPNPAPRFLATFFAIILGFYLLVLSPWVDAHLLYPVLEASAHGTSYMLGLFGDKTAVEGVTVRGANYSIAVRRGCDPLEPIILFAAGVVAFPAPWNRRLAALVGGGIILFGVNLVRLSSLFVLGARRSPLLESFHLDWWPAFYLVFSLALWTLWLQWVRSHPSSRGNGQARAS